MRGGEGEQDIPLAPAAVDEFMEESEEEEGGEGGDSEESENEGVMIVDEADEGGDSEDESQEEFRDEDGLEVHGVLAAQAVPEKNKKTSWKGRGISALFLVCKELNNLVAVHLFKVSRLSSSHCTEADSLNAGRLFTSIHQRLVLDVLLPSTLRPLPNAQSQRTRRRRSISKRIPHRLQPTPLLPQSHQPRL